MEEGSRMPSLENLSPVLEEWILLCKKVIMADENARDVTVQHITTVSVM